MELPVLRTQSRARAATASTAVTLCWLPASFVKLCGPVEDYRHGGALRLLHSRED